MVQRKNLSLITGKTSYPYICADIIETLHLPGAENGGDEARRGIICLLKERSTPVARISSCASRSTAQTTEIIERLWSIPFAWAKRLISAALDGWKFFGFRRYSGLFPSKMS